MIGIYFSGTGNSKYALEVLLQELCGDAALYSIEDETLPGQLPLHEEIVFSYPVQYSAVPKILKDFICRHGESWQGKRIFVISTMALFNGDGAGVLARLLKKYGAHITGGLHLQMPDSIADEKVLKRTPEKNALLVQAARKKAQRAAGEMKCGKYPKEGLGPFPHMLGFWSQRLWFGHKTEKYFEGLKIAPQKCIGCAQCAKYCPTKNIHIHEGKAVSADRCTLCYRCVNLCPKQAITLLGKKVIEQKPVKITKGRV